MTPIERADQLVTSWMLQTRDRPIAEALAQLGLMAAVAIRKAEQEAADPSHSNGDMPAPVEPKGALGSKAPSEPSNPEELENKPDLVARVPIQLWVIVAGEQPPPGTIITPTHHPDIYLAWRRLPVGAGFSRPVHH